MIFINDEYCIGNDQYNWILCRNKPETKVFPGGKEGTSYPQLAFFSTLQACLLDIRRRTVRKKLQANDYASLSDALKEIRAIDAEMVAVIRNAVGEYEQSNAPVDLRGI